MSRTLGAGLGATILNQDIYEISDVKKHRLGTRCVRGDKVYRYAHAGMTFTDNQHAIWPNVPAWVRNAAIPSLGARAIGENTVLVTVHTDDGKDKNGDIAAHSLEGGNIFLYLTGANEWINFTILDNTVVTNGGTMVVTLDGELPVAILVSTSYCEEIMSNPYYDMRMGDSQSQKMFMGVPARLATTTYPYHWIQTWGPCRVAPQARVGIGNGLESANQCVFRHDGSVDIATGDDGYVEFAQNAGVAMTRSSANEGTQGAPHIFLQISP